MNSLLIDRNTAVLWAEHLAWGRQEWKKAAGCGRVGVLVDLRTCIGLSVCQTSSPLHRKIMLMMGIMIQAMMDLTPDMWQTRGDTTAEC